MPVYRSRSTNADLARVDAAIMRAVAEDAPVSLRGVYYRVVSAGAVPKTEAGYTLVMRQLVKLRRDGRVRYWDVSDGTRWITKPTAYSTIDEALDDTARTYRRRLWDNSRTMVMFFIEKDALSGVVKPVTDQWDVFLGVLRGYASETFAWQTASLMGAAMKNGKDVKAYQLGDHDPSGVDAWRAFTVSVNRFLDPTGYGESILGELPEYTRLAVTREQIAEMNLPTRPTKQSDKRAARFHGDSVEVDAIPAPVLRQLVTDAITAEIDQRAYEITLAAEESERELLYLMKGLAT